MSKLQARVWFPDSASYVVWVCWFASLLWEAFPRELRFSRFLKNLHLIISLICITVIKQIHRTHWVCGDWAPETSWSYHYWQPAPRWRPHWWLAKPDNRATSPHALDKTGTRHTYAQWKAKGGEGRKQKALNAPHVMLLLPATMINKHYSPAHKEFYACANILNPLTK